MNKFFFFILLFLFSCSTTKNTPQEIKITPKEIIPINDFSHTPLEAVKLGAPSIDKTWTPSDYESLANYISNLDQKAYPRFESEKSKDLFMKSVNAAELSILLDTNLSLDSRMQQGVEMMQAVGVLLNIYVAAFQAGNDYSTELAYLQGVTLSTGRQLTNLLDEFIPTIDKNDGKYEVRMEGLQRFKNGMALMIDGALMSMTEREAYSLEERKILAGYLSKEGPTLINALSESVRIEFEIKIKKLIDSEKDTELRNILFSFVGKIRY